MRSAPLHQRTGTRGGIRTSTPRSWSFLLWLVHEPRTPLRPAIANRRQPACVGSRRVWDVSEAHEPGVIRAWRAPPVPIACRRSDGVAWLWVPSSVRSHGGTRPGEHLMPQEGTGPEVSSRTVVDALSRAVVVTDSNGRITLWNRAAELLYGWAEAEVLGRSVLDVLAPPDQLAENSEDLRAVAGGRKMSGDRLVVSRDGTIKCVHTATAPVLDHDGNTLAIVGTSEDVGELRMAEQRARDLSEQYRLALEAGGLGTWRWDVTSGETVWDERLESLFGFRRGGFDGSFDSYVSMLHPDDRESVLANVDEAVRTKSTYRVEHRVVWPDGSVHWINGVGGVTLDDQGEVDGTVGCAMDTHRPHRNGARTPASCRGRSARSKRGTAPAGAPRVPGADQRCIERLGDGPRGDGEGGEPRRPATRRLVHHPRVAG